MGCKCRVDVGEALLSVQRDYPPLLPCFFFCPEQVLAASALEGDKRITLSFRSSQYAPQTLLGRDVSSTLPPFKIRFPEIPGTNAGWIDTTFIDEEIRVARSVFALPCWKFCKFLVQIILELSRRVLAVCLRLGAPYMVET